MSRFFSKKVRPQNKSSQNIESTQVLYLVSRIENIFITAHYEEIIKYFIVHKGYFHSG